METKEKLIKVLIAEDDESNRIFLERLLLPKRGFETRYAENGYKVLDMYHSQKFDVILMDIKMPLLNGVETTKRIRDFETKSQIEHPMVIIGVTAQATIENREIFRNSGMDEVIFKPIIIENLLSLINKHVAKNN